jgi:hypothetical protein
VKHRPLKDFIEFPVRDWMSIWFRHPVPDPDERFAELIDKPRRHHVYKRYCLPIGQLGSYSDLPFPQKSSRLDVAVSFECVLLQFGRASY